ncbi:DUF599 domain-containing protein [Rhodobacter ferrooxidans]|uniref:DUF599 domain-containing protein n=1 Tax=Rhodobacter ferrooxidans TaxID=371731 RepID=C8S1N3_9RHOB|nr:DUF599 domain-containing protein [Rhodobacter sp. SW2]EEW25206.1 protein of unknown function DUF599 [Rhodobacter sp. SW2]
MDLMSLSRLFTPLDGIAAAYAVLASLLLGRLVDRPGFRYPSVSVLMMTYRREWMREFITRDPRIFDSGVLDGLRQGITFYASACIIAIGSGLALVGNTTPLQGLAQELTLETASALVLKVKILFVLAFLVNAFLKFVWSHRLFGYCSIMMAAVPNDISNPECLPRAAQAAELNITAARAYNRGLRSVYFALGALGWFLGPEVLLATITLTLAQGLRREFASQSRAVMLNRGL